MCFRYLSDLWKYSRFPIRPPGPEIFPDEENDLIIEQTEKKTPIKKKKEKKKNLQSPKAKRKKVGEKIEKDKHKKHKKKKKKKKGGKGFTRTDGPTANIPGTLSASDEYKEMLDEEDLYEEEDWKPQTASVSAKSKRSKK